MFYTPTKGGLPAAFHREMSATAQAREQRRDATLDYDLALSLIPASVLTSRSLFEPPESSCMCVFVCVECVRVYVSERTDNVYILTNTHVSVCMHIYNVCVSVCVRSCSFKSKKQMDFGSSLR